MARKKLPKEEKFSRRQDQNRKAQARCRQKKMDTIANLELKLKKLQYFIDTHCDPKVFKAWMAENKPPSPEASLERGSSLNSEASPSASVYSESRSSEFSRSFESSDDYQPQSLAYGVTLQPYSEVSVIPVPQPAISSKASLIEALGCPKDVPSYSPSDHAFQAPVIRPQPTMPIPYLPSPGRFFVGGHQLGHLLAHKTGMTPSITGAYQLIFTQATVEGHVAK